VWVEIPFEGKSLPGLFHRVPGGGPAIRRQGCGCGLFLLGSPDDIPGGATPLQISVHGDGSMEDEEAFDRVADGFTLKGHANKIQCPALMVTCEFDPLNPIEQTEAVYEALSGFRELWVFKDKFHILRSVEAVGGLSVYSYVAH